MRRAADAMRGALQHRGPDGHGQFETDGAILGHMRLAIIDLAGGRQPMTSPAGDVALSYNGECYNFGDLTESYAQRGWRFATRCDTEAVLAGYCLDGETADERLNGMFAYALLDERSARPFVLLSTDPVGIKPLFLYENDGVVLFASELQAIVAGLASLGRSREVASAGVEAFLRFGWVPAPATLLRHVRKLLPGERWVVDIVDAQARPRSRNALRLCGPRFHSVRDFDAALAETLKGAVARQLISDVPLGIFLSGGIDSSLVLATARELGHEMQCFTIGFSGPGQGVSVANETAAAEAVAKALGGTTTSLQVDEAVLQAELFNTLDAMDQPLADPACLPLLLLSRFARESVKVCLSGDGGDELFAGYPRHALIPFKRQWHKLPPAFRGLTGRLVGRLPTAPGRGAAEALRKARVLHGMVDQADYVAGPFSTMLESDPSHDWNGVMPDDSCAVMRADIEGQLAGQMLPKTDNMTMAASLECRVPLLDLELISLASGAPMAWKRGVNTGKLPLRRLLARHLPPAVTGRAKQGFRVPLTSWLRGPIADEIKDRLLTPHAAVQGVLPSAQVETLLGDHLAGRAEHSVRIFALLALNSWLARTAA